jgi:hypothetical protein
MKKHINSLKDVVDENMTWEELYQLLFYAFADVVETFLKEKGSFDDSSIGFAIVSTYLKVREQAPTETDVEFFICKMHNLIEHIESDVETLH